MGKKVKTKGTGSSEAKTAALSPTAQADPETEEEIFGCEEEAAASVDPLTEAEDYEMQTEILPDPVVLPETPKQLPLNQVPGKFRKFLNPKD